MSADFSGGCTQTYFRNYNYCICDQDLIHQQRQYNYNRGQYTKITTTDDVREIIIKKYKLIELVFPNTTIMNITIQNCPLYIYLLSSGKNEDLIDLSPLENLTDLRLMGITKDVMFPAQLNSLAISQATPNQFKILNDKLVCKYVTITNFDVSNVRLDDCENLTLQNDTVYNQLIDLSSHTNLTNLILNNVQNNVILSQQYRKLVLALHDNSQYLILNKQIQCNEILITNYNLFNIELEFCSSIQLSGCNVNRLSLTNLVIDKLQISFTKCEIKVLDYSESNCLIIDNSQFINNKIEKVILPHTVEKVDWTQNYIDELVFPTLDRIKSINITLCPRIIYSTYNGIHKNTIIDLSIYVKLQEVILHSIKNDIILPASLNKLLLDQHIQFKYQIYNQIISCDNIKITNFNIMNIQLESCSSISLICCIANSLSLSYLAVDRLKIKFTKCEFNVLDYSESNLWTVDDSWFVDNKVQKVILPNTIEKINWSKYYIDELVFATLDNIMSINLKLCPRVIYSTCKGTKNTIIDLSDLAKLEEVILHGIKNNILLPDSLSKLELDQPEQFKFQIQNQSISCNDTKISNFNLMNIELKDCSTISLTNCTADSLSLTNLVIDKLQIIFTKCEFNTLDFSESNLLTVDESWFVDNKVEKVILPNTVEKINWSKYYIDELVFPTVDSIKSIVIELCPRIIYSLCSGIDSNTNIDLSDLVKLEEVILHGIKNNILLPDKLSKLELDQPEQFKFQIQNQSISCDDTKISNFNLMNIELKDCSTISLTNCTADSLSLTNLVIDKLQIIFTICEFNTLDYSESNCLNVNDSQFLGNIGKTVILPNGVETVNWNKYYIDELIFHTIDYINSININFCPKIIYSTFNRITQSDIIDLSRFTNLEKVHLKTIENNILLPNKLNKLELVQNTEFQYQILNNSISCTDITVENYKFSHIELTDCESLELWNCDIITMFLENQNMKIKIRNSRIGICKFQEEVDVDQFLNKCQRRWCQIERWCQIVSSFFIFFIVFVNSVKSWGFTLFQGRIQVLACVAVFLESFFDYKNVAWVTERWLKSF